MPWYIEAITLNIGATDLPEPISAKCFLTTFAPTALGDTISTMGGGTLSHPRYQNRTP